MHTQSHTLSFPLKHTLTYTYTRISPIHTLTHIHSHTHTCTHTSHENINSYSYAQACTHTYSSEPVDKLPQNTFYNRTHARNQYFMAPNSLNVYDSLSIKFYLSTCHSLCTYFLTHPNTYKAPHTLMFSSAYLLERHWYL